MTRETEKRYTKTYMSLERTSIMKFEELNLQSPILKAIEEMGYEEPSLIQEKAIPPALAGKDIVGCAQTGSGKTAAFSIPILQKIDETRKKEDKNTTQALILTPTRELALQISQNIKSYGKYLALRTAVVFGGVSAGPQIDALKKGVDILVATPGRLMDLYGQGYVDLSRVNTLVLDEADRMLDMGFVKDIRRIMSFLPDERQTLLFSATMPDEILRLIETFLTDPIEITVTPVSSTVDTIEQSVYFVDHRNKISLLVYLLKEQQVRNALVFTRTKRGADRVESELRKKGIAAAAIHGDKAQKLREQALSQFKSGKIRVLVATDIAARGIDVEELSHVINYNLPDIAETYVHRIGRTGRAGRAGVAISFCDYEELGYFDAIETLIGQSIKQVAEHPYPMMQVGGGVIANHQPSERVSGDGALFAKAKETGFLKNNQVVTAHFNHKVKERRIDSKQTQKRTSVAGQSEFQKNVSSAAQDNKQKNQSASGETTALKNTGSFQQKKESKREERTLLVSRTVQKKEKTPSQPTVVASKKRSWWSFLKRDHQ